MAVKATVIIITTGKYQKTVRQRWWLAFGNQSVAAKQYWPF